MMQPFFEILMDCLEEEIFVREIRWKYHYDEPQLQVLAAVAASMLGRIQADIQAGKAGWSCGTIRGKEMESVPVCITLGPGVDALQESYLAQGMLTEAYMVENIAAELLLKAYPQWNEWVAAGGVCRVRRYHFPGSEPDYPVEKLPELLQGLQVPVTCTAGYCMLPKKTVAFYAELTLEEEADCQGICVNCGSRDCPNRMKNRMGED
jgi:hypothetical protein